MLVIAAPEVRGIHRSAARRLFALAFALLLLAGGFSASAQELHPWRDAAPPPLVLERLDGDRIDLASRRGGPVIVHFFATWCAPCIEEMASLNALSRQMPDRLTILAVSVGEVEARLRNFFRPRPVAFPILLDRDRAATKTWDVLGLPASFVLDRELRPVWRTDGPLDWTSPPVIDALSALTKEDGSNSAPPDTRHAPGKETIR